MIHIVTHANRHHYASHLAAMHQLRREHFVEGRGWKLQLDGDDGERDSFDDERTIYFFALGPDSEIQCSMRARPTDDRCMLADVFPDLVAPGQPAMKGGDVWEISRIFTTRGNRANAQNPGLWRTPDVLLASMEHAARGGASRLVAVVDLANFARMQAASINIRLTGLPHSDSTGTFVGVEIANTTEDTEAFRRTMGRVGFAGYEVDDEDIELHGSLAAVERAFDRAAVTPMIEAEQPAVAIAQAEKSFRKLS